MDFDDLACEIFKKSGATDALADGMIAAGKSPCRVIHPGSRSKTLLLRSICP